MTEDHGETSVKTFRSIIIEITIKAIDANGIMLQNNYTDGPTVTQSYKMTFPQN